MQTLTFHANGGTWKDQPQDEKEIQYAVGTEFHLADLRELILEWTKRAGSCQLFYDLYLSNRSV